MSTHSSILACGIPWTEEPGRVQSMRPQRVRHDLENKQQQHQSVRLLSRVWLFATPWTAAPQASLSITNSWSLHKLMSIELVMHPTISSSVIPFSSSGTFLMSQLFASGGQSIEVSASASIRPMNSGLISFRVDWLDLLAVQGTCKSLLQHHSSKASILWCSFLYSPTLTSIHDYWKNHSLE